MRTRSLAITFAFLAIVIVMVTSRWVLPRRHSAKPVITIGVLSYGNWGNGPSLAVRVGMTNTGRTTLRYSHFNLSGDAMLRTESRKGWTTRDIEPRHNLPGPLLKRAVLSPGSNSLATIVLPSDTLRWQVSYEVSAPSLRARVVSRLPNKWRTGLDPICKRLFSDKEGPTQVIVSDVFECPHLLVKESNDEYAPIFDFDPIKFFPSAPNAK
jgi:hypothetical protein